MQELETFDAAYRKVLTFLMNHHFTIKNILPINNNRYMLVLAEPYNVFIKFSRDTFHNFGKQFEKEGETGVGDSVNVEDLKTCIQNNVHTIYSTFPNGHIYSISLQDFLTKSFRWEQKEGTLVRSISIHHFRREAE